MQSSRNSIGTIIFIILIFSAVLSYICSPLAKGENDRGVILVPGNSIIAAAPSTWKIRSDVSLQPTPEWLEGTWSARDNSGEERAPCALTGSITFLPTGMYVSSVETGRYALNRNSLTTWGRATIDEDAGMDMSDYDVRSTTQIIRSGNHKMERGNLQLYRCDRKSYNSLKTAEHP